MMRSTLARVVSRSFASSSRSTYHLPLTRSCLQHIIYDSLPLPSPRHDAHLYHPLADPVPAQSIPSKTIRTEILGRRIVYAMTLFTDRIDSGAPFTKRDIERFMLCLRNVITHAADTKPNHMSRELSSAKLWRPPLLDPSVKTQSLPLVHQCMLAMAGIWDAALEKRLTPSNKTVSAIISSFSECLPAENLLLACKVAVDVLISPTGDADRQLRDINHGVLTALMLAFARAGQPNLGQELLHKWALAQPTPEGTNPTLSGWSHNPIIWSTLIRSYSDAKDLQGARMWLQRYRQVMPPSQRISAPYLAMASAYMQGPKSEQSESSVRAVLNMLSTDKVRPDSKMLTFLADFSVATGSARQVGRLLETYPEIKTDPYLLKTIFRLISTRAEQNNAISKQAPPDVRATLKRLFEGGNRPFAGYREVTLLNEALKAAMAVGDYPAARVVLATFGRWRLQLNSRTQAIVMHALAKYPVYLFDIEDTNAAIAQVSESIVNSTQRPERIRPVLNHGADSFHVRTASEAPLRSIKYLRDLLNRAIEVEVEQFSPEWPGQDHRQAVRIATEQMLPSLPTLPRPNPFAAKFASRGLATCAVPRNTKDLPPVRLAYIPYHVPYALGLALQEHLVSQRAEARALLRTDPSPEAERIVSTDTLLLLQHSPVYTEGRRETGSDPSIGTALRSLGADYHLTKRGGQITYHGPGQLVGYPILDIGSQGLSTRCYVDRVQDFLIHSLKQRWGMDTVEPPEGHTGVWADEYHKVASIGIQVRHRVTSHGFALNVQERSMRGFGYITACGIQGRSLTSIEQSTGEVVPMQEAVNSVIKSFEHVFKRRTRPVTKEEFDYFPDSQRSVSSVGSGLKIQALSNEQMLHSIKVDSRYIPPP